MGQNKLLPMVAAVVMLMVLFIGIRSCRDRDTTSAMLDKVPEAPAPDADSPADTIRTLTAEVATIKAQNKVLEQRNKDLVAQRKDIERSVSRKVGDEMDEKMAAMEEEKGTAFSHLVERIEQLGTRVEDLAAKGDADAASDIPPGLGIGRGAAPFGAGAQGPAGTVVWIEPLRGDTGEEGNTGPGRGTGGPSGASLLHPEGGSDSEISDRTDNPVPAQPKEAAPEPVYTIPRNATLVGSQTMTALIGRIPFDGQVNDPFPFKVLIGRDNLAANGLEIPGVFGMVFSGQAFGDWALSCVRGSVRSVTYIFEDGTIRTLSSDDQSLQQQSGARRSGNTANTGGIGQSGGRGASSQAADSLGWISDRRGIPCVTGVRISNASDYLAGRIAAKAAEAASEAFAFGQSTRQISPLTGVATTTITGDTAKFAGYNALAGASDELSEYLKERASQSFDVVYVDTGIEVAVHVDRELPIDYDPDGRKLFYARSPNASRTSTLD